MNVSKQSDRQTLSLIRRMITMGYSDQAIAHRLRHPEELAQAIREQMRREEQAKHENPVEE